MRTPFCDFLGHIGSSSLLFLTALLFSNTACAISASQTISLQEGWNAVFLEVQPADVAPEKVFAGQPVEMCAAWLPTAARVESLTDPGALPTKAAEWHVWQPEASPSAFLNNLRGLKARQALLIKAGAAATFTVSGEPVFERRTWVAPSFNLTGFDVDPAAPPTFARFFDGSRAHAGMRIFKLVAGKWQAVAGSETIQRGKAYWVWCNEGSDFQGPVDVSVPLAGEGALSLANDGGAARLELSSNGTVPVTLNLSAAGTLPLLRTPPDGDEAGFSSPLSLPLGHVRKTLALRRVLDAAPDSAEAVLTIKGGGMSLLLPVRGSH